MKATRLRLAGAFIVAALAVAGLPASADAAFFRIINKQVQDDIHENWCLTNLPPNVYIYRCGQGNRTQLWEIWRGGWTRNVGSGYCLNADDVNGEYGLYTASCISSDVREHWVNWQGGWYLRPAFVDARGRWQEDRCLARAPGSVHGLTTDVCTNPNGSHPGAEWFVVPA